MRTIHDSALDPGALAIVTGGASSAAAPPPLQPHSNNALAFLGGGWSLGIAHHPEMRSAPYGRANDPNPYLQVYANKDGHTASVLVNATTGAALERLH
jgi:hypothetical protein